jgi:hypothetical protein
MKKVLFIALSVALLVSIANLENRNFDKYAFGNTRSDVSAECELTTNILKPCRNRKGKDCPENQSCSSADGLCLCR